MKTTPRLHSRAARRPQRGVTLVEIMISLLLGLVLLGAATSIYLSNRQAFRQVESMARVQENARTAFEMMARDLREAGGTVCGRGLPTANVVQGGAAWWMDFGVGLRGYGSAEVLPASAFGNGAGERVNGTEALVIWSATQHNLVRIVSHDADDDEFDVSTNNHGLVQGDIIVACDFRQAAITQVSNDPDNSTTIEHDDDGGVVPGNCREELGLSPAPPHDCSTAGSEHSFAGGFVGRLQAVAWYVGHNGRGGRSLYRAQLQTSGGATPTAQVTALEMIENVTDLDLFFLQRDPAQAAAPVAYTPLQAAAPQAINWAHVVAVRVAPTYTTADRVGTDGAAIAHTLPFVVSLRNPPN